MNKQETHGKWGLSDLMVLAAFRYCLGRRTYIVGDCAGWIVEQWPNFAEHTRDLIRRELEQAFEKDDDARAIGEAYKILGHDCDREEWEKVRGLWQ